MTLQLLLWPLPWFLRRRLLSWLLGWYLHPTSRIGFSIILVRKVYLFRNARVGHLNLVKGLDTLEMGEDSSIGHLNQITGVPTTDTKYFRDPQRKCELVLKASGSITCRHIVDCCGGVTIGQFSTIAGYGTQILSHSVNIVENRQVARPVVIGLYCFVGTGCILLPGSYLPTFAILAAGSVLTKAHEQQFQLYAGAPARPVQKIMRAEYFHRTTAEVL